VTNCFIVAGDSGMTRRLLLGQLASLCVSTKIRAQNDDDPLRLLHVPHPRLILLDEATEGLAPVIRDEIWQCIGRLRERGQAVLIVDKHLVALARVAEEAQNFHSSSISDWIYIASPASMLNSKQFCYC